MGQRGPTSSRCLVELDVRELFEQMDMYLGSKRIVSPGLKVSRMSDGALLTVARVGPRHAILVDAEGELLHLTQDELENEYEIR